MPLTLTTDNPAITLRELSTEADAKALSEAIAEYPEYSDNYGNTMINSLGNIDKVRQRRLNPDGNIRMCAWKGNELVGYVSIAPDKEGNAEIGYFTRKNFSGQGISASITRALIAHALNYFPEVYAFVHEDNLASIKVVEKAGFAHVWSGDKPWGPAKKYSQYMLKTFEYSPITPEILDIMVELEASVVLPRKEESILLSETRERLSKEIIHPGAWAIIGYLSEKPTGFIFGFPATYEPERDDTDNRENTEYLSSLCIRPESQGQGYGTKLLHCAEEYVRSLGKDTLVLFTAAKNEGARRLYIREGWQEERITERQLKDRSYTIVHYIKKLDS